MFSEGKIFRDGEKFEIDGTGANAGAENENWTAKKCQYFNVF